MSILEQVDQRVYDLATDGQREKIDAWREHGTCRAAGEALGCNAKTVQRAVEHAVKKASANGYAPDSDLTHQTAPGNAIKRVSTNYDGDGNIRQQWVIQEPEKQRQLDVIRAVVSEICEEIKPVKPVKLESRNVSSDLIVNIPIGDAHIGLLVWGEECGEDYDLTIADSLHRGAIDMLIEQTPEADTCAIIDLGDYLHSDNQEGMTSRSGHSLDMDGRYHKVIRCAIALTLYYINKALLKFNHVVYRPEVGNHNDIGAIWMQELLTALYANEPRVTIGNDAGNVFFWQWGECFFMSHHGHQIKGDRLYQLFAKKIMDDHLKTKYRKIYAGHVHHKSANENAICEIETYRTLAAKDAYSAGAGYHAQRGISAEVWHKKYGEMSTVKVNIPMLEDHNMGVL
jgi:hypothetical protein